MSRVAVAGLSGLLLVVASCGDSGNAGPAPAQAQTLDLGNGVTATLGADGSFSLTRNGATVVTTNPGLPLFSGTSDPTNPGGWHDPTQPTPDLSSFPIDLATVTAVSVPDGSSTAAIHLTVPQQPADTALVSVSFAADGGFYTGLGEQFAHVSASGRVSPMFLTVGGSLESDTNEAHVPVPFLVSSNGWGVFVASREAGAFDVAASNPQAVTATFEGTTLDVWFFVDTDPLAVVSRYNRLAGLPRPLPRWALSPIHWRHWASSDDVISIATEYREQHIPSSALWLDDGWQSSIDDFVISPTVFGDLGGPADTMSELAALGFRVMAWTSPYLEQPHGAPTDDAQELYVQAQADDYFVEDGEGNVYASLSNPIHGGAGILDFTSAPASAFWEGLVSRGTATGLHGFKCDYGEDFIPNLLGQRNPVLFSDGTTSRTARLFPIQEHTAYHAALDAAYPGDGVIIARASSWGGATQADVIWPGDLDAGFEHQGDLLSGGGLAVGGLPAVVIDAQTLGVSGFPAFGSDTAGYRGSPTAESELRWMEHTALTVVMQVYEDGTRLPWLLSDTAGAEYQAMASLHQQLEPYNAILVRDAQASGAPTIRPLPLVYPQDPATFGVADGEYLLGPDLLVAPVTTPGATTATVHLPPGAWVHWWSDVVTQGPADVTVAAPLGSPPFFARAGGLVPMLPEGIDTLVEATVPGVVTLASQAAEMRGRAWATGSSSVILDDGAAIVVSDLPDGVHVSWTRGGSATNLTLDVDLRTSESGTTLHTVDPVSGAAPTWTAGNPGHVVLRFVGSGAALVH